MGSIDDIFLFMIRMADNRPSDMHRNLAPDW